MTDSLVIQGPAPYEGNYGSAMFGLLRMPLKVIRVWFYCIFMTQISFNFEAVPASKEICRVKLLGTLLSGKMRTGFVLLAPWAKRTWI